MLELKNIVKDYLTGDNTVHALRGVSLRFRNSEFVSILGQSGCGKTTMLNIIGGLDRYTSGDLMINGRSTKNFKDRDWDAYRNHSVGFVFQSYNLIPHQTVLQNVELALSLSGVSKAERRKKAKQALASVGLADQLHKKPSEMSGGQMQRVAIARAIVNNPDIILADEPTGALDSETSLQVMEILKEIAKDRLVIMVTHNPDLAEEYSTRTIRMLDGEILSDSAPMTDDEIAKEQMAEEQKRETAKKTKMPSMSFATSFGLSLRNLFTKKTRTMLTSFAGSIGIIGIALIFSVSNGFKQYIDAVQEETLSSFPLSIQAQHMDLGTLMSTIMGTVDARPDHENDAVYQKPILYDSVNILNSAGAKQNDLKSFKAYIENLLDPDGPDNEFKDAVTGIQYTYDYNLLIYTKDPEGNIICSDTQILLEKMLSKYMGQLTGSSTSEGSSGLGMMSMFGDSSGMMTLWQEILPGDRGKLVNPLVEKQYDLIYGNWPSSYDEILIVVDENNEISDMTLFALGLISEDEMDRIINAAVNQEPIDYEIMSWSYEDICDMKFRTILGADCYVQDRITGLYTDLRKSAEGLKYLYDNGLELRVSGIIRQNPDSSSGMISGTLAYTSALTKYLIEENSDSPAVLAQMQQPHTDIFTGLPFKDNGVMDLQLKKEKFIETVALMSPAEKAETYLKVLSIPDAAYLNEQVGAVLAATSLDEMRLTILQLMLQEMAGVEQEQLEGYVAAMNEETIRTTYSAIVAARISAEYAARIRAEYADKTVEELVAAFDVALETYSPEQFSVYYDGVLEFSTSTYELNMATLNYVMLDTPSSINLYVSTFADKDVIKNQIDIYNSGVDELSQISYTDLVGILMSSVTTIIDAITYVLIAFVSVSLIVSSIMIGVITLISVQERTKEIGILRALGASKRNVSSMFNAETLIIGFTSGALGVIVTWLVCIPINAILFALTGIAGLQAELSLEFAIFMILVSMGLTLFSGIIPSRSAAKKDPVVALRTE